MVEETTKASKFWAYIAVLAGAILLIAGAATTVGYLGLPIVAFGEDILGPQLGQMAGMFLGLVCGSLAIVHGLGSILKRKSRPLMLAPPYIFLIVFAVAVGLGNLLLNVDFVDDILFPLVYLLGAALPTVAVLAWAFRKLAWPLTWRYGALAFVTGSTLSVLIAIVLEIFLPITIYVALEPLEQLASSFNDIMTSVAGGFIGRLFSTPLILVFLLSTAVQAPFPEELSKAIGLRIFGRSRITEERQAFAFGLASGAGFAILENMLYEGIYAQMSGWSWAGITLLRGTGSVLHPLCTGIVALGWFRARQEGWKTLFKAYLLAVGLHTLWNGGFLPFVYLSGVEYMTGVGETLSIYGLAVEVLLVVFLIALATGLWWYLHRLVRGISQAVEIEITPTAITPRTLAVWSLACVVAIIPIGAALGPAWRDIQAILFFN